MYDLIQRTRRLVPGLGEELFGKAVLLHDGEIRYKYPLVKNIFSVGKKDKHQENSHADSIENYFPFFIQHYSILHRTCLNLA
jgi:hypothetical protein